MTHVDLRDGSGQLIAGVSHVVMPQTREVNVHDGVERVGPGAPWHLEPVRAFNALLARKKPHTTRAHAVLEAEASRWFDLSGVGLELCLEFR